MKNLKIMELKVNKIKINKNYYLNLHRTLIYFNNLIIIITKNNKNKIYILIRIILLLLIKLDLKQKLQTINLFEIISFQI